MGCIRSCDGQQGSAVGRHDPLLPLALGYGQWPVRCESTTFQRLSLESVAPTVFACEADHKAVDRECSTVAFHGGKPVSCHLQTP